MISRAYTRQTHEVTNTLADGLRIRISANQTTATFTKYFWSHNFTFEFCRHWRRPEESYDQSYHRPRLERQLLLAVQRNKVSLN